LDARVEMTFNAKNWKGLFPDTYKALRPLASAINAAGGRAVEYGHYHLKFLREAFRTLPLVPSAPSLFEPPPLHVPKEEGVSALGVAVGLFMLLHHRKERIRRDGGFG